MTGYMAETGYTDGEGSALLAPLIGAKPTDIEHFVIIGLDPDGKVIFGASSAIRAEVIPRVLRAVADSIETVVNRGAR